MKNQPASMLSLQATVSCQMTDYTNYLHVRFWSAYLDFRFDGYHGHAAAAVCRGLRSWRPADSSLNQNMKRSRSPRNGA